MAATLKSMDVTIDDKEMEMAVVNGLPKSYETLIVAVDAPGSDDVAYEVVKSGLLQEEQHPAVQSSMSSSSASLFLSLMKVENTIKCTSCGRDGYTAEYHCMGMDVNGNRPCRPSWLQPGKREGA